MGNFASKNYDFFGRLPSRKDITIPNFRLEKDNPGTSKTPSEEEVVDLVNKWRIADDSTPVDQAKKDGQSKPLNKDNVASEEVVEIIKDHRDALKTKAQTCAKLGECASPVDVITKMREWSKIYHDTGNEMEWDAIQTIAVEECEAREKIKGEEELHKWMAEQKNMTSVRRRIVELAEQQNLTSPTEEYWSLNDDVTKRLEDVNRYQDEKETKDKRPILESPSAPARKPVSVIVDENASDEGEEEKNTESENEDKDSKKEATEAEKTTTNTNKTKKKRNKRRNKK